MAKLISMFLILIGIQACLLLYADQSPASTDLWTFVTNIDNWNSLTFILGLVGIAAGIGLTGVVAASIFGFKTDFLIFAPAIAGFISMAVVVTNLANVLRDDLTARLFPECADSLTTCTPILWILSITIALFALYYVWTVIEWWRGKDY